jgi:hypothetical protein
VCPRHALAFACSGKLCFIHDMAVEIACSFPHVLLCKLLWQIPCSCQGRLILILMWDAKGLKFSFLPPCLIPVLCTSMLCLLSSLVFWSCLLHMLNAYYIIPFSIFHIGIGQVCVTITIHLLIPLDLSTS